MNDLKYTDILSKNRILGNELADFPPYEVKVISNIITSQIHEILEFSLRSMQINAKVSSGDYDNIVQDSQKYLSSNSIVVFWELANIIEGLQYKADTMDEKEINKLVEKVKSDIDFVFANLSKTPLVIFNEFSSLVFNYAHVRPNAFDKIAKLINQYIEENLPPNFVLINIDKVISNLSIQKSIDLRYYYSSKSLYTIDFYKAYTTFISPVIYSILGKSKKALIFDCDNTIWKGILGEDGIDNIEVSAKSKNGIIFEEIQHIAVGLAKKGIIVGLCSKNNPGDVEEVFERRDDMTLKNKDILVKKINWDDKVTNLKQIAEDLNIGTDSLVFVDDSPFELSFVEAQLPEVATLTVPEKLYSYPSLLRENISLFYQHQETGEDGNRLGFYKNEETRKNDRQKFTSLNDYLGSLELSITITVNDETHIARVAQMTQKTNQFNLTTRRHTVNDITEFIRSGKCNIYTMKVTDKFGDYGITGVAIIGLEDKIADVKSFLMSCRIIGRNIEIAFLDFIVEDLRVTGAKTINAYFIETFKNKQVEFFYDKFGFNVTDHSIKDKSYSLQISDYKNQNIDYINLNDNNLKWKKK